MDFIEENIDLSRVVYESEGAELEGLILKPEGAGPFPAVIYIHGHRSSAWESTFIGYFLLKNGFAAFLPSQIGYGMSKGEPDYCGPKTVQGVLGGIEIFLKHHFVDKRKVGLWGISRGAIVAASLAVTKPELFAAGILQSGAYDIKALLNNIQIEGIRENYYEEAGKSDEAIKERSTILKMEKLSCPTLILHGEKDDRYPAEQIRLLDKKLTELNKEHETVILPDADHFITRQTRREYTLPFLKKHLQK